MTLLFAPTYTVDSLLHSTFVVRTVAIREAAAKTAATTESAATTTDSAATTTDSAAAAAAAAAGAGAGTGLPVTAAESATASDSTDGDGEAATPITTATAAPSEVAAAGAPAAVSPDETNAVWPMLLWAGGVSFPVAGRTPTTAQVEARMELLRLLIALCSGPLYATPNPAAPVRNSASTPPRHAHVQYTSVHMPVFVRHTPRRRGLGSWTS